MADEKPGLLKALNPIKDYFEYLVKKQYKYGYCVFFNINITRNNVEDVRQLTGIAHDYGLISDYHINESPMIEEGHFKHLDDNDTFIRRCDWPRIDELVDWLILYSATCDWGTIENPKFDVQQLKAMKVGIKCWSKVHHIRIARLCPLPVGCYPSRNLIRLKSTIICKEVGLLSQGTIDGFDR